MAHIKRMTDKARSLPWRAQVKRKGHKVTVKMFKSRAEAEHWASEHERIIRLTGLPPMIDDLKKHTLGEFVRRYRDEITPTKGCRVSETAVLNKFLRHALCSKSAAFISRQDAYAYSDERHKDRTPRGTLIKPSTVRREINTIQHIFEVARDQWGFSNLQNPFRGLKVKGSMHRRNRRLMEGELSKLARACEECRGLNSYYVPLAVYLAVETGMRLQEIFNLTWREIDIGKRRIVIRKSKTDYRTEYAGRTIVLTLGAQRFLIELTHSLGENNRFNVTDKIFPMTKDAFKQSWSDVLKRADIDGLTFHDLRREAGSRFHEAGLDPRERNLMLGHETGDMDSLYISPHLNDIQDKLDRHMLDGMTFHEALKKRGAIVMNNGITGRPKAVELGQLPRASIKFDTEEDMRNWIEKRKREYSRPGFVSAPFPPKLSVE